MEKDYSLLRPFDLEAAKRGEKLLNGSGSGDERSYVDGPDYFEVVCVKGKEGGLYLNSIHEMKMYPLAWVEGRPVYKGDVLWHTGRKCTVIVDHADEFGHIHEEDDYDGDFIINLTWQKQKTKRDGWVNIYKDSTEAYIHQDRKSADENSDECRVACLRIEWEE